MCIVYVRYLFIFLCVTVLISVVFCCFVCMKDYCFRLMSVRHFLYAYMV